MNKLFTIATLVCMFFTLNKLYSDDNFDALFDDIEEINNSTEDLDDSSAFSISGEHEFLFTLPYIDTNRFETPVFNNTFAIGFKSEYIDIISMWKINIPENVIIPDENYIKLTIDNTIINAGFSLFSWGHSDSLNPTDKLNSRDYTNSLDIEKIPTTSISIEQYWSNVSMNFVYIPVKTASLFPTNVADEIPETLIASDGIIMNDTNDIDKFLLGTRINYYGQIDLSISYIYNYDELYVPDVQINPDYQGIGAPLTEIILKNQRVHQIGFSGKTILDIFGLWLEVNYSKLDISANYLEWTAGFDFNFGKEDLGYLNVQTTGKWCPDYKESPGYSEILNYTDLSCFYTEMLINSLQNIKSEFSLGLITKLSYGFLDDKLEPELISIYLTSLEDSGTLIFKPAINYKAIDSLMIILGMNIINSIDESKFYEEEHQDDSVYLSVKYVW